MAFKKMVKGKYPPRLWSLRGYPGSGKSTFASQMRGPMLVVDADQRFEEVLHLAEGDVYTLSERANDNVDTRRIETLLDENMPAAEIGTIVVDSLTSIIAPLVTKAIQANDAGENKNRIAAFKEKALAMRQLQDAVTRWGTDVLVVYHLVDARDGRAKEVSRPSISETELARLMRSLNLSLEMVLAEERRGVKVVWARRGRSGMVLWDESGCWRGMPEAIEQAVYDGLTDEETERLSRGEPVVFPSPEVALAWAVEQGVFDDEVHARNAYEKLKREAKPRTAGEMAALWISDVRDRTPETEDRGPDAGSRERPRQRRDLPGRSLVTSVPAQVAGDADGVPDQTGEAGDELNAYFPRHEALEEPSTPNVDPTPPIPEEAHASGNGGSEVTATQFWGEFYKLKGAGRIAPELKDDEQLQFYAASQAWDKALLWLQGQVRVG